MGFYAEVRNNYGRVACEALKSWSSYSMKLASYRNRRVFLLECKRQGLLPKHISSNMNYLFTSACDSGSSRQVQAMLEKSRRLILQFEITVTVTRIGRMESESSRLWQILEGLLPPEMLSRFESFQSRKYRREFAAIRERNLMKVRALSDELLKRVEPQERWVRNVSSVIIPDRILKFLALGPKFSIDIPLKEISMSRLLSDVESIVDLNDRLSDEGKNIKRSLAANIITNYIKPGNGTNNVFQREFYHCKRYLKEHQELLVLRADKGNVTVLMDKTQYIELSNTILLDEQYYQLLTRDPTITIQGKCNTLIKRWVSEGHITQIQGKLLYNYNSVPARFYGLPKIHKPTLALRPIISSINTPTSKLSIFISDILSKYLSSTRGRYFVEDSFAFAQYVNDFQLPVDYVLISLDVVSLFTNIPVDLAVSAVESRWETIRNHTSLPREEFIHAIEFLFSSNYFTFDGKFFKQILGSPMGSNFSPSIAEVVMDFLLDCILANIPFYIPFIKKYVDDLICAVPKDQVAFVLDKFNSEHERVQFTLEEETANGVSFLDTRVIRTLENRLILDWYQKPTNSGRYLHYFSNHPHGQKVNVVLGLRNRIEKVAHPSLRQQNLRLLLQLMLENGYPKRLLSRLLYNTTPSRQPTNGDSSASTIVDTENTSRTLYSSIPLINGMTKALINLLKTTKIKLIPKSYFKVDRLYSRVKDKMTVNNMSCVVYCIPCSTCGEVYIGQTSQLLKRRIAQHKSDIKNPSKICALAEHTRDKDHPMNYDSTKILECEVSGKKRCFLEMYHIKRQACSMNYRRDVNNISSIYSYLIHYDQFGGSELAGSRDGRVSTGSAALGIT